MRRLFAAIAAGVVGAVAVTALGEVGRRVDRRAPRLDLLGERALANVLRAAGIAPPPSTNLRRVALAGDFVASALYYSMLFAGRPSPWKRGLGGGLVAGLGTVALARALGIDRANEPSSIAPLGIAWYAAAGLTASAAYHALAPRLPDEHALSIPRAAL